MLRRKGLSCRSTDKIWSALGSLQRTRAAELTLLRAGRHRAVTADEPDDADTKGGRGAGGEANHADSRNEKVRPVSGASSSNSSIALVERQLRLWLYTYTPPQPCLTVHI